MTVVVGQGMRILELLVVHEMRLPQQLCMAELRVHGSLFLMNVGNVCKYRTTHWLVVTRISLGSTIDKTILSRSFPCGCPVVSF
jgi:hypothetical protein